jgi:hypothetical protein
VAELDDELGDLVLFGQVFEDVLGGGDGFAFAVD